MTNSETKNVVLLELISPNFDENYEVRRLVTDTEAVEIKKRAIDEKSTDWSYVFEPIADIEWKNKLIDLFNRLDEET